MAETTAPTPRPIAAPRRRAFFGLFDADGWGWATVKAIFWFVLMIMLLGYLPDRAYYFTVQKTVDLGLLLWAPINFCPPSNETLPCPVPTGATLPWQPSPPEIQLPGGREDGVAVNLGTTYLYIGGSDGKAPVATVHVARAVGDGNLDGWKEGPPLPEARSSAAGVVIGSTVYVVGGYGPDGKPTDTTYAMTIANDGTLGAWTTVEAAKLPVPLAGLSAAAVSDGFIVMGGTDGTAPTTSVWKTQMSNATPSTPQAFVAQNPLVEANVDGVAFHTGDYIYLVGGSNASGPVATVQIGTLGGPGTVPANPNQMNSPWKISSPDEPARPADESRRVHVQRRDLRPGRLRRDAGPQQHPVDDPGRRWRHPALADPVPDRPRRGDPGRRGARRWIARLPVRGRDGERPDGRRRAHEPRPAAAVLPAGPARRHGAGAQARRRDRAADRLRERRDRRRRQLHPADPRRLGTRAQGARAGDRRLDPASPGGAPRGLTPAREAGP